MQQRTTRSTLPYDYHDVYNEARAVLRSQVDELARIERKAMQLNKFIVLLIAGLAAVFRLGGTPLPSSPLVTVGSGLVVVALLFGILTTTASSVNVGVAPSDAIFPAPGQQAGVMTAQSQQKIIYSLDRQIRDNSNLIWINGWLLLIAQASLSVGIVVIGYTVWTA
ncbi:hypothetical protein BRC81_12225 [Halobacteriales archaeon QS_1_68_20]|nr:MAG: hypothetical protein BRC81_12225 [Halobacteriales archaeon QS_1_68_20]